jgi:hypothetical protein
MGKESLHRFLREKLRAVVEAVKVVLPTLLVNQIYLVRRLVSRDEIIR